MKFSLSWILEHIESTWQSIDVADVVNRFNRITAEIETFKTIRIDIDQWTVAQVTALEAELVILTSPELGKQIELPKRDGIAKGQWFLIFHDGKQFRWATLQDAHSEKEGLFPQVWVEQAQQKGGWKKHLVVEDAIIEVDNKSITNRPDLWGHRGMAREIAAFYDHKLVPAGKFLHTKIVKKFQQDTGKAYPFEVAIEDTQTCKKLAGLYCPSITVRPSDIGMAFKLARVDARPIDAVVDITNYVMFDWGQPMHAFDAKAIQGQKVVARHAQAQESLVLLDGAQIALAKNDIVIADSQQPLSLAGIMGGKDSGVHAQTTTVFLESGCFDATSIRVTSTRVKKRTEASARFEKTLDPLAPEQALQRFLAVADQIELPYETVHDIVAVGPDVATTHIEVSHAYVQDRLGVVLTKDFVLKTLHALGFEVKVAEQHGALYYTVAVPSWRASKDISIKQDIVEEIARCYGYGSIAPVMPAAQLKPHDLTPLMRLRKIKQFLAYTMDMQEVYNYAFFDEQFLQQLNWQPGSSLAVQQPVSENWSRLATTLVPNLLKNIQQNSAAHDQLRFFEWGRTWQASTDNFIERKSLAAVLVDQKNTLDFYAIKQQLQEFFAVLHIPVTWVKVEHPQHPWFAPYESAHIMHGNQCIGTVGKAYLPFTHRIVPGDAFIIELDGDFLWQYKAPITKFEPLSKYPEVVRDVSLMIPLTLTVDQISAQIKSADAMIASVSLVDFFESEAWKDRKSVTMRFVIRDYQKTLTTQEVEQIEHKVHHVLASLGATIR